MKSSFKKIIVLIVVGFDGIPIDDWLSDIADLILNPGTWCTILSITHD